MNQYQAENLKVETEWNGKVNACVHCGRVPQRFYVATGHDHTDYEIDWCPCREVAPTVESLERQLAQAKAVIIQLRCALSEALESGEDGDWQSARLVIKAALNKD